MDDEKIVVSKADLHAFALGLIRYCHQTFAKTADLEKKADKSDILFVRDTDGGVVYKDEEIKE